MPRLARTRVYDIIHRSAVGVCVGFTVVGTGVLTVRLFKWLKYRRPVLLEEAKLRDAEKLAAKQAEQERLLMEGSLMESSPKEELG